MSDVLIVFQARMFHIEVDSNFNKVVASLIENMCPQLRIPKLSRETKTCC